SPARDTDPSVLVRVIPIQEFEAKSLGDDVGKERGSRPRVVVFSNVPQLSRSQDEAVSQFLADGGGVLVTLGGRVEPQPYNVVLYRRGQGWLPARVDDVGGDEGDARRGSSPLTSSFFHPALDLFRDLPNGGLADARFPRWWKVTTVGRGAAGVPVALLSSNSPFLIERSFKGGRVLLCTVPLDNSWRTNLPDLPAFAPLAHELVFYLASARAAEHNLQAGQPLRWPVTDDKLTGITLTPPEGPTRPLSPNGSGNPDAYPARVEHGAHGQWLIYEETRATGTYRLRGPDGSSAYFVLHSDPRESDLAPCTPEDRERVNRFVPVTYL